jgi:hypothetical protein
VFARLVVAVFAWLVVVCLGLMASPPAMADRLAVASAQALMSEGRVLLSSVM